MKNEKFEENPKVLKKNKRWAETVFNWSNTSNVPNWAMLWNDDPSKFFNRSVLVSSVPKVSDRVFYFEQLMIGNGDFEQIKK